MTDIAVGDGDQLHVMPELRPLCRRAARPVLRVVRVRAEHADAQFAVIGGGMNRNQRHARDAPEEFGEKGNFQVRRDRRSDGVPVRTARRSPT